MMGLHGVYVPRRVKTPRVTAMTATMRHGHGAARPVLFAFAGEQRKQKQGADADDRER